jgi:Zn-finger nucleic acid-binding protein
MAYAEFIDPICPTCQATLALTTEGQDVYWHCPNGHGKFVNLATLYSSLQMDEIEALWKTAQSAAAGPRKCPISGTPMRQVTIAIDDDEDFDNNMPGAGNTITLDVSLDENGIWFDTGEFDQMPKQHEQAERGFARLLGRLGLSR